jgi:hypothetical protein
MPLKYSDAAVLVKKSPDGKRITRVNAIVMASAIQPKDATARAGGLKDRSGKMLPEGEYLDLAIPRDLAPGVKAMSPEVIFQQAVCVPAWREGAWIGWEPADLALTQLQAEHTFWTGEARKKEAALQSELDDLKEAKKKSK